MYLISMANVTDFCDLSFNQVSDVYSMHYTEVCQANRQQWLLEHYKFACSCKACRFPFCSRFGKTNGYLFFEEDCQICLSVKYS